MISAKLRLVLCLSASLLLECDPATANVTAAELYQECTDKTYADYELICVAYLRGFGEGIVFGMGEKGNNSLYCPPKAMNVDTLRTAFEKFSKESPTVLSEEAAVVLAVALMRTFPCRLSN